MSALSKTDQREMRACASQGCDVSSRARQWLGMSRIHQPTHHLCHTIVKSATALKTFPLIPNRIIDFFYEVVLKNVKRTRSILSVG